MKAGSHLAFVNKLKKQLRLLQRKEALVKKLDKAYGKQFASTVRALKSTPAAPYVKVAVALEQRLLKNVEKQALAVAATASMIEKKLAVRLGTGVKRKAKKGKGIKKSRKVAKKTRGRKRVAKRK